MVNKNWIRRITSADNLYWAWSKVRKMFAFGDSWVDLRELARFEGNLNFELESIARDMEDSNYSLTPLKPILYPKKSKEGHERELRQWFNLAIRDQVAWAAVVNIIGPYLDYEMPAWSYSYRLYRPAWYEQHDLEDRKLLKVGYYRNSLGQMYRKFNQSWPLYRRQIFLSAQKMTKPKYHKYTELTEGDVRVLEREGQLKDPRLKLDYLDDNFWKEKADNVYWASFDLRKFFPNISLDIILKNTKRYLAASWTQDLDGLLRSLLKFPLDFDGFTINELNLIFTQEELEGFSDNSINYLQGLPTGLFVSGFLSNLSMLHIDNIMASKVKDFQVAHFRYVDDHTVLSPDFDALINWIRYYEETLQKQQSSVRIHPEKIEPKAIKQLVVGGSESTHPEDSENIQIAKAVCKLDPRFPTPLMTKTLALVSAINDVEFELLDEKEQEQLLENLEHLLLVNIPDHELRTDTRISFAASKISRLAPIRFPHYSFSELYELSHEIQQLEEEKNELNQQVKEFKSKSMKLKEVNKSIERLEKSINKLEKKEDALKTKKANEEKKEKKRTFSLLLKTLDNYPEKIRIWSRLLEFCRNTGYQEVKPIFDKLFAIRQEDREAYYYYRTHVLGVISKLFSTSVRVIGQESALMQKKVAGLSFIKAVLASNEMYNLYKDESSKYYEVAAEQVLECVIGMMCIVLKNLNCDKNEEIGKEITQVLQEATKYQYLDFVRPSQWIRDRKTSDLSIWAWFADQHVTSPVQKEPSILWSKVVGKLRSTGLLTWPFYKKYPKELKTINKLFESLKAGDLATLEPEDEGLIYEYFSALEKEKRKELSGVKSISFSRMNLNLNSDKAKFVNLYGWIEFIEQLKEDEKNRFDPRSSEWTAVAIAKNICELYTSNIDNMKKRQLISPANYWLPKEWVREYAPTEITWKKWNELLLLPIKLSQQPLTDVRYTPIFMNKDNEDKEFAPIRGLGLITLGLIIHDFNLPATWNPKGHSRAWGYLVRLLLQNTACSSLTGLVLEACLLSKPKENIGITWQKEIFEEYTPVDTDDDPPLITSIADLGEWLHKAAKRLEKYQISVQNNLPRQLTPVAVKQLKRIIETSTDEEEQV